MMDAHYPNAAWLCLQRDVFEKLLDYKVRNGIPTFERALEELLQPGARIGCRIQERERVNA